MKYRFLLEKTPVSFLGFAESKDIKEEIIWIENMLEYQWRWLMFHFWDIKNLLNETTSLVGQFSNHIYLVSKTTSRWIKIVPEDIQNVLAKAKSIPPEEYTHLIEDNALYAEAITYGFYLIHILRNILETTLNNLSIASNFHYEPKEIIQAADKVSNRLLDYIDIFERFAKENNHARLGITRTSKTINNWHSNS